MRVGIPKENAPREQRIAAVPSSVKVFAGWDWEVVVETGAGVTSGFPDEAFVKVGASIVPCGWRSENGNRQVSLQQEPRSTLR